MKREIDSRYFVEAAAKTLDVLESFGSGADELSIIEVARRVGVTYSSAFRLLYTLEKRGYVMRRPGRSVICLARYGSDSASAMRRWEANSETK